MSSTRPLDIAPLQLLRYQLQILSGSAAGATHSPDSEGVLRVGRAPQRPEAATPGWAFVDDPSVSQLHLELVARPAGVVVRDTSRNGTWLGDARLHGQQVEVAGTVDLRVGEVDLRLVVETRTQGVATSSATCFGDLTGTSAAMRRLFARVAQIAPNNLPVLITGENGTGKSALAKAIHQGSRRASRPFVVVDCAALSKNLLESELFGHRRGAFTGAVDDRESIFEEARGGTVLLDEVADLPADSQGALLGVLQDKRVRRVGENRNRDVDVRVIAATNRDLPSLVARERFRLDLYMRLAVCTLELPPLRERPEDVLPLAETLLERVREEGEVDVPPGFALPPAVREDLARREWPGNVRELYNYLRYYLATGDMPRERIVPPSRPPSGAAVLAVDDLLDLSDKEAHRELARRFDRLFLRHKLRRGGGRQGEAARLAEMHRVTFARRYEDCGLRREGDDDDDGEQGATG